jgi:TRAP-type C4-dicarboxylate transport system permease small subunit
MPILHVFELARVGFVWSCLLGATIAYKRNMHISFSVITSAIPKKAALFLTLIIDIITLAFFVWVLRNGISFTIRVSPSLLPSTGFSSAVMYSALPTSMAVMTFHCLNYISEDLVKLFGKKPKTEDGAPQ